MDLAFSVKQLRFNDNLFFGEPQLLKFKWPLALVFDVTTEKNENRVPLKTPNK
jgi:hypothetical protein